MSTPANSIFAPAKSKVLIMNSDRDLKNKPAWQSLFLTSFLLGLAPSLLGLLAKLWF